MSMDSGNGLWQRFASALIAVVLIGLVGCSWFDRRQTLESVAKEWSMTIRASQVVPVYPLTEDLQPGDVFLVQMPVDRQHEIYDDKGFLPFDNHLTRLHPEGYGEFYDTSFGVGKEDQRVPRTWLKAGAESSFGDAPTAAFPSYRFSVRRGGGFNLALPVEGVPVGLSLLGADAADGTINISDARTYGVDLASLADQVEDWARSRRPLLESFAPRDHNQTEEKTNVPHPLLNPEDRPDGEKESNYLRVIYRVYMTGGLDVSLRNAKTGAAGLRAGAATPVSLPTPRTGEDTEEVTLESYKQHIEKLNAMLDTVREVAAAGTPGGALKVTAASAGSITLKQTFQRPLVIGYLGFDMEILEGGQLGPPVPTHAILTRERISSFSEGTFSPGTPKEVREWNQAALTAIYNALKAQAARDAKAGTLARRMEALPAKTMPERYPVSLFAEGRPEGDTFVIKQKRAIGDRIPTGDRFQFLTNYWNSLDDSVAALSEAMKALEAEEVEEVKIEVNGETEILRRERLQLRLMQTSDALARLRQRMAQTHTISDVIEYWCP
jgi:hypothetical protein